MCTKNCKCKGKCGGKIKKVKVFFDEKVKLVPEEKSNEKEFTVNLDVRMFGKDAQDVIRKVDRLMKNNKYWLGDINEFGC
jgi:L-lactate utilization protein LutB